MSLTLFDLILAVNLFALAFGSGKINLCSALVPPLILFGPT